MKGKIMGSENEREQRKGRTERGASRDQLRELEGGEPVEREPKREEERQRPKKTNKGSQREGGEGGGEGVRIVLIF